MALKIDLTGESIFVTKQPRQQYEFQSAEDREAGRPRRARIDQTTNQPLWAVELFILGVGRSVLVNVPGEPVGLAPGQPAMVAGLTVNHWQMTRGGKLTDGVTYRADRIESPTARKVA